MNKKVLRVAEAVAYAAAGFAIALFTRNIAYAQSASGVLDPIKQWVIEIVDNDFWALLPAVYTLWHAAMFAKTWQMPMVLKAVGGAFAAMLWVGRWEFMGRFGAHH